MKKKQNQRTITKYNKTSKPHNRGSLLKIDNDDTRDFAINLSEVLKSFAFKSEYFDPFEVQDLIHGNLNEFLNERFNANIKEGETK